MVARSWSGARTPRSASSSAATPDRARAHRPVQREGSTSLGTARAAGCRGRLTQHERSRIIALVKAPPPRRLARQADGTWPSTTRANRPPDLDALTAAAHELAIQAERSQVRRILLREGALARTPQRRPEFAAKAQVVDAMSTRPSRIARAAEERRTRLRIHHPALAKPAAQLRWTAERCLPLRCHRHLDRMREAARAPRLATTSGRSRKLDPAVVLSQVPGRPAGHDPGDGAGHDVDHARHGCLQRRDLRRKPAAVFTFIYRPMFNGTVALQRVRRVRADG